jgi:hypothetical protein
MSESGYKLETKETSSKKEDKEERRTHRNMNGLG